MTTRPLSQPPPRTDDGSASFGSPVFSDHSLAALADREGALAAWKKAIAGSSPVAAAAAAGGDFAVAVRDGDGRCVLAVDRFAIRTLCYRVIDGELRFAVRADALSDAGSALSAQAIFDYLYFHVIPSPRTIFEGVHRLPPGHVAIFDQGRLAVVPYWKPTFREPDAPSFPALRAEFRQLLRDAVTRQLDGSKPACFLSGGTDSSTVAGMIGEVSGRAAATYSIGFDAEGYDEMTYARIAARHFKTEHHEHYLTPDELVDSIALVAGSYDQPFGNSSALPAYWCARVAREDGVGRLLAGDGGDELFGGNSRYAMQRVFGVYSQLPAVLRKVLLDPLFGLDVARKLPLVRKGAGYVRQANTPMPDRLQHYNLLLRLGMPEVLTASFLSRVAETAPLEAQRAVWAAAADAAPINAMLAFDWRYTLAESDLPKVVGSAALAGITAGFPFLDQALVDFSLRLPPSYKLNRLRLRWFFKEALRGFLPDEIITKKKKGFGLPFGVWVNRHDRLKRLAVDSLRSFGDRGVVRPQFINTLLQTHLQAHPGYYGEMVWILMMMEQWLRQHAPRYRADA
jgi:asparagine synthase (glutamine-hydrolysing)